MHVKIVAVLLPLLCALAALNFPFVHAAEIATCTLDKSAYYPGGSGYVNVTVYNDKGDNIRVTEVSATVNYFYADGTQYTQTFYANATLPVTIAVGQSTSLCVQFTLPANIAPGYGKVNVRAKTEIWNSLTQRWIQSDNPTYELLVYIESPYKQQLQNLEAANNSTTLMMYLFVATTVLFALMLLVTIASRRTVGVTPPSPQQPQ
ncbi:MAG: hypothetical protein QXX51_02795 [Candidatus Bathyarchaeia archaeon]